MLTETDFAIAIYVAIISVILFFDFRLRLPWKSTSEKNFTSIVFLVSSLALLLDARRQVFSYDLPIIPDEATFAARAMMTHYGWLNWNVVDTVTSGPLNSSILAWPYLLGGEVTLFSTRLTGVACVFGTIAMLFLSLRQLSDCKTAIVSILPGVIFFAATTDPDFIHYSSEHLPNLLISIAVYLFVCSFNGNRTGYLAGSAFALGLVPFAKLQAAPIAIIAGTFVLARAILTGLNSGGPSSALRRAGAVLGAACLPALVFLVPLAISGDFDDFVKSYLIQPRLRVTEWANPLPRLLRSSPLFRAVLIAEAAIFAITIVSFALSSGRSGQRSSVRPVIGWSAALGLFLALGSFLSMLPTGSVFPHYLLLAVPTVVFFGGASLAAAIKFFGPQSRIEWRARWLSLGAVLVLTAPYAYKEQVRAFVGRAGGAFQQAQPLTAVHSLSWLRPIDGDRIVCWGWWPQCYLDGGMPPATRDSTNENQLFDTALRPYFRSRFLADFARSHPDFVIDFVTPGGFWFVDPQTEGIGAFRDFADVIDRDFVRLSQVDPPGRCPRLYMRAERMAAFNKSRIEFSRLTATGSVPGHPATALDDGSTFEICDDNWLLPQGTLGAATIDFREAGPLGSVAILNTRNGDRGDWASSQIRVTARLADKAVASRELTLEPFPRWTFVKFGTPVVADSLTIQILSYKGAGGGLNEIKAYRD